MPRQADFARPAFHYRRGDETTRGGSESRAIIQIYRCRFNMSENICEGARATGGVGRRISRAIGHPLLDLVRHF